MYYNKLRGGAPSTRTALLCAQWKTYTCNSVTLRFGKKKVSDSVFAVSHLSSLSIRMRSIDAASMLLYYIAFELSNSSSSTTGSWCTLPYRKNERSNVCVYLEYQCDCCCSLLFFVNAESFKTDTRSHSIGQLERESTVDLEASAIAPGFFFFLLTRAPFFIFFCFF